MKSSPAPQKTPAQRQEQEILDRYIQPYFNVLTEYLDDNLVLEQPMSQVINALVHLVIQDNNKYDAERRAIRIDGDFREQDDVLMVGIREILPKADQGDITFIYNNLFGLLHEFRFNMDPNSILDQERNALVGAQHAENPNQLYQQSVPIIGTLAHRVQARLNGDNKGAQFQLLSNQEVERIVVAQLRRLLRVKLLELKQEEQKPPLTAADKGKQKAVAEDHDVVAASSAAASDDKKRKQAPVESTPADVPAASKRRRVIVSESSDDDDDVVVEVDADADADADHVYALQLQQMFDQEAAAAIPVALPAPNPTLLHRQQAQQQIDEDARLAQQLQQEQETSVVDQIGQQAQRLFKGLKDYFFRY